MMMIRLLPLWFQCSLLHPNFIDSSFLRWVRLLLTPINVYLTLTIGVEYCFLPFTRRGMRNLGLGIWTFHFAAKSLEWGITGGFWDGKYWTVPNSSSSSQTGSVPSLLTKENHWSGVAKWTTAQFFSLRGLQYGWGPRKILQRPSIQPLIRRLFLVNLIQAASIAFLVIARDQGSPTLALAALGVPNFWARNILAEGIATLSFGLFLLSSLDVTISILFVICHAIHGVAKLVNIPRWILNVCDPIYCQPIYGSLHTATSLSWFWGKGWHQLFRRSFLMCGAFPASTLAKIFGGGLAIQKICGLFGSFFVSALMHEYAIHVAARKPHPHPHIYFTEFPAAFLYFLAQPIGIILEPYIIPLIPRFMGGGRLWVLVFTLITATPFRIQYSEKLRNIDDAYRPVIEWTWWDVLIPGRLT
ncbi:hypothetical protein CROQUDRAFT_674542 [Cronartium quercuum f. sp. fusiforme G11]|uniref:Wax synthase domain-containing protein n=1 Tax=Cronartium quercuum f. sp. fusiforme G11 TaxID=708437 RepID=A0A9P6NAU9_9BASI|nr:hypothetical protein CROQUDRAFT_674542 [Cronartium quercuum f. sp. fusiforme G11]